MAAKYEDKPSKGPRLVDSEFKTGSMRRPPYELKIIKQDDYDQPCWNNPEWTDDDAGAFNNPTERAPLILIINEDMAALREFKQALTKRNTEQDVQRNEQVYLAHRLSPLPDVSGDAGKRRTLTSTRPTSPGAKRCNGSP